MSDRNRQWRLASYPEGMPKESDWALAEGAIPDPRPGEVLARAIYLDVAPYMRSRISPQRNYAQGIKPGDVMVGGGIGEVVHSSNPDYRAGDVVVTDFSFGWQDYAALRPTVIRRVDAGVAPLPCWLDALGLNGMTSYFALLEAAGIKAGDVVVVSAAAGSVGQIAGQIAKLSGCRAIAVTSTAEKLAWCRELTYDDGINYREEQDLPAALARVCPKGVDVYVDNTAGPILDAVMQNLATDARIVMVGSISHAGNFGKPDIGPRFPRNILMARARIQGFLVSDYYPRYEEARRRLAQWYQAGKLRGKFDLADGLESAPRAFLRLLTSQNLGKQLVRVRDWT